MIVPALLPLVFNGQWRSALATAVGNILFLALVYGVIGFGLTSILRWTLGRLLGQLRASLELFARAIPLLMIFSVVLFLTVEMWEVFSDLPTASFVGLAVLFIVLGTTFLVARIPREVRAIERDAGADAPALDSSERVNVGLVMFVSQALQVLFGQRGDRRVLRRGRGPRDRPRPDRGLDRWSRRTSSSSSPCSTTRR